MLAQKTYRQVDNGNLSRKYIIPREDNIGKADKKVLTKAVFIASFVMLIFISLTAISANMAYSNSLLASKNKELKNEVQSLKVVLQENISRSRVEKEAAENLGMIYPTSSQFVELSKGEERDNFSEELKKLAFEQ